MFQRMCDDYQCLILIFSVIYLDSWGYIGWWPPSGYLKSLVLSFSFLFFSILHFLFCLSLSGAPLAPGPLDIVHPCHPVATPLNIVVHKLQHSQHIVPLEPEPSMSILLYHANQSNWHIYWLFWDKCQLLQGFNWLENNQYVSYSLLSG